ncbi:MAG: TolC family protein [Desulfobulbaceae bacterium]|nr:TolC family protein [Desulfobulbaceae bacterium]
MKHLGHLVLTFISFTLLSQGVLCAAENQDSFVLDNLVKEALTNNPELNAAKDRWKVYENKIVPAGSLSDPTFSFSLSNYPVDTFQGNEFAMSGKILKLAQSFPFPGKLSARREIATEQSKWFKAVWNEGRLQLTRFVKDAYYLLYYYDKSIAITQKNLQLLKDFTRLTETNYEVGKGLQQDVLKAQVEHSKLTDRLFNLSQQRDSNLAELNRLLNRPTSTQIEKLDDFEPVDIKISLADLQEDSQINRPMYAAYDSLINRYKAEKKLARLDYKPDFKVGLAYSFRESNPADGGTDFAGLEFSMNLPIFQKKRDAAVAEADSGLRMASKQYDDFQNKVHFNIHDAYTQVKKNFAQAQLYKSGIIPQARQVLEASISNYQVGKVNFFSLLDNFMTLYNYEMEYYKVLTDGQRNIARLEAETGQTMRQDMGL